MGVNIEALAKKKPLAQKLGANKAVKSREDGVTRFFAGYTVFFLCSQLFRYL